MTMAPVPLRGMNLALYSSSTQGMRNASVFPEPADDKDVRRVREEAGGRHVEHGMGQDARGVRQSTRGREVTHEGGGLAWRHTASWFPPRSPQHSLGVGVGAAQ